ncbi:MAG: hypothetical protein AB8B55_22935 [Mariniblastus sp.]
MASGPPNALPLNQQSPAPQPMPPGLMESVPAKPPLQQSPFQPDLLQPSLSTPKSKHKPIRSRREAIERGKKKSRQAAGEMDDFSSNLQSSGIFLVVLPVIATVLPFVGLQHRRLRNFGDSAPLAAMFLGIIGAGCIFYARRNKDDGPMVAGAAALFTLLAGVGGYFMVSQLSDRETAQSTGSSYNSSAFGQDRGPSSRITPAQIASRDGEKDLKEKLRRQQNARANRYRPPEESSSSNQSNSNSSLGANPKLNEFGGRVGSQPPGRKTGNPFDDAPDFSSNSPPRLGGRTPSNEPDQDDDPFKQESEREEPKTENPFGDTGFIESLPNGSRGARERQDAFQRWGKGMVAFARVFNLKSEKLPRGLKLGETVGAETDSGRLFAYRNPILGVEVLKVRSPVFVPIEESGFPSENAIADETGKLAGFRLAFEDEHLVGIQGIFAANNNGEADLSKLRDSHWLGLKTENVGKVMAGAKKIHGFVCFFRRNKPVGLALVLKR